MTHAGQWLEIQKFTREQLEHAPGFWEVISDRGQSVFHAHFTLLLPDGGLEVFLTPWQNTADQRVTTAAVRLQGHQKGALAASVLTETWVGDRASVKGDEVRDRETRREQLMLILQTADGADQIHCWSIEREPGRAWLAKLETPTRFEIYTFRDLIPRRS